MAQLADVWARVTDLDVVAGQGSWVTTADGTRYLDMTAGIAVTSTGHCHPAVVEAIQDQATRFLHAQLNVYRHDRLGELVDALDHATPDGIDTFFLTNSGAEAIEAAIKLAKHATGRTDVIVFRGGFHGRTHLAMAMTTSKATYRGGYRPFPDGITVVPYPDRSDDGAAAQGAVEAILTSQIRPDDLAAIVIEPVLGEGGYVPAPERFLTYLRDLADRTGALLVADEIQSGIGRTGTMFAVDRAGVSPDVITMAKGLGSGFPIAAIGTRAPHAAKWVVGSHGGTYGGNPMGCAAAIATLGIIDDPDFLAEVRRKGDRLRDRLRRIDDERIVDVRGPGLMVGVEFVDGATSAAVRRHCLDHSRVILMGAGTAGEVLRLMPPLTVTDDELDTVVAAIGAAVAAV